MDTTTEFFGIELIVDDLDRAIAFWVDVFSFSLVQRGPSTTVEGEMAIVSDGRVVVTLLAPAATGSGHLLADRTPRLTQIVLDADASTADRIATAATEHGLSVTPTERGFFVAPEVVAGALGFETAVVVTDAAAAAAAADTVDR